MKRASLFLLSLLVSVCTFAQNRYLSYDWAFFEVYGRVSSITYIYDDGSMTEEFSREGVLNEEKAQENEEIYERDEQGRIVALEDGSSSWEWNGMTPVSEYTSIDGDHYKTTYIYTNGKLTGYKEKGKVYKYRILKTDSHGNWLQRSIRGDVQKREITYYE